SEGLAIVGGNYTLTNGMKPRSMLTYNCPEGHYPFPSLVRYCANSGRWNPPPRRNERAECKLVTCPDPLVFEYGSVSPTQLRYYVNNQTTYECFDGYKFVGSATRVCQPNGKWSGSTPICDRSSAVCPDPGVPAGSRRGGNSFDIDDKVTYRCDQEMVLVGSSERVCQESGEWTGTEPACYYKHTYDTPQEVAKAFSKALNSDLELAALDETNQTQHAKKIRLEQGGNLHIYIAIDASDSVQEENFQASKNTVKKLIEKIDVYEVTPKYEILFFATDVKEVVDIIDPGNVNVDLMKALDDFKYTDTDDKTGTDITKAFRKILEKMSIIKARSETPFKDIRHVIIFFSDGQANMGGSPDENVARIKSLVRSVEGKNRDDYLDIYTFGVGPEIEEEVLNRIRSHKDGETHFFKLKEISQLDEAFDKMIGVHFEHASKYLSAAADSTCIGSLISSRFVVTAAHCFKLEDTENFQKIKVYVDSPRAYKVKKLTPHPKYDNQAKKNMGISEFYDYDVALIELEKDVPFTAYVRPICIPCTKETSRAIRLPDTVSCKDQGEVHIYYLYLTVYLSCLCIISDQILCFFFWQRPNCIKDALLTVKEEHRGNVKETDIVTDNFLCTGGIDGPQGQTDDISCKGDSGGALYVQRRRRLVQVGVVSWGTKDMCKAGKPQSDETSRDFHINLFKIKDFLKQHLGKTEESYAPLTFID
ncbi:complement factor B, partial [Arapaima gigas]